MPKSNVIDMTTRRRKQIMKSQTSGTTDGQGVADLLDMKTEKTNLELKERRKRNRFLLSEFFGATVVVPSKGLEMVSLLNITEDGLAFDIEKARGRFRVGEELALRIYLSQESYLPVTISIKHVTPIENESVFRHGCEFVALSEQADLIRSFVQFVKAAGQSLRRDKGDLVRSR